MTEADCCLWPRVVCNETSGHVIKLKFHHMHWNGSGVDPSLLALKHLYYLDLSYNGFRNAPIPTFIGQMKQLQYLDLSNASFSGRVPPQLGNLTKLRFLDIGDFYSFGVLQVDDHMKWIYNLSFLTHLGMDRVNLKAAKALNLMKLLNSLPFLKILSLYTCELDDAQFLYAPSNSSQIPTSSLEILNLSYNSFVGSVPSWISNITSLIELKLFDNQFNSVEGGLLSFITNTCRLRVLDLSNNNLHGNLGIFFGRCNSYDMEHLDLGDNKLNGSLWSNDWLGKLRNLRRLDVSSNLFSGPIFDNLGQLRSLEGLIIQNNYFEGVVTEVHFANLSHIRELMIGNQHTSVSWKIRSDWIRPFNLDALSLQYLNSNGSEIPQWIRTQTNLRRLELLYSNITGTIPTWLGELTDLKFLDLSNNQLTGSIPQISPHGLLEELYLARNQINGSLSTSFCNMKHLSVLDISENRLLGSIPDCWSVDLNSSLIIMRLSSNQLSGVIPNSLNNLYGLQQLRLGDNHFHGEIPYLANCSALKILDLGRNKLSGNITKWAGNSLELQHLAILGLRENKLNGNIPSNLCQLQVLHILDLANNNITGTIPRCLGYLPMMIGYSEYRYFYSFTEHYFEMSLDHAKIVVQVIKGRELNYSKMDWT